MKTSLLLILGAALILGCAAPALAHSSPAGPQYQSDQDRDRDRNTQAYNDGYAQGQDDAHGNAIRNDRPPGQWTKDDDQRAYRQGYEAGWENVRSGGRTESAPSARMGRSDQQAEQFGYQDGLAAGRHDRMKGDKFKPHDKEMYEHADHGWTPELGPKDQFKQLYREGFVRGYDDGYRGNGPR